MTTPKASLAVIHGRFQPLHIGHMEYLLAGKELCDVLIVGITNPDPWQMGHEESDPKRGAPEANPCTYYERFLMVEGAMVDAGIPRERFRIVPFPHSYPERLIYYAPPEALYLLSIYDSWGETKMQRFRDLGLPVHVLWRRKEKVTSGGRIRELIRNSAPWETWVPAATAKIIRQFRIDERIRKGSAQNPNQPQIHGRSRQRQAAKPEK